MMVSTEIRGIYENFRNYSGMSKEVFIDSLVLQLFYEKNGRWMDDIEMWDNHSELKQEAREVIIFLDNEIV